MKLLECFTIFTMGNYAMVIILYITYSYYYSMLYLLKFRQFLFIESSNGHDNNTELIHYHFFFFQIQVEVN